MRAIFTLAVTLLSIPTASAAWKIEKHTDRVSGDSYKVATLSAGKPDHGVSALLIVACLKDELVGGRYVELRTTATFTPGKMGLRYRIDNGQVQNRYMWVTTSRTGLANFARPPEFNNGKKLRIEMYPAGAPSLFYAFDLTGTQEMLRAIPCKETRL